MEYKEPITMEYARFIEMQDKIKFQEKVIDEGDKGFLKRLNTDLEFLESYNKNKVWGVWIIKALETIDYLKENAPHLYEKYKHIIK